MSRPATVPLDAIYKEADLPEHRGNPLIEALPPFRRADEIIMEFGRFPHLSKDERACASAYRMLAVTRLNDYLEPLPEHFAVIDRINLSVRAGYTHRNPDDPLYLKSRVALYRSAMNGVPTPIEPSSASTSCGFAVIGISGSGKSSAVDRTLSFLPQVLRHPNHSFLQLVWVKIDCPIDGRLKQFCLALLDRLDQLLGTKYKKDHRPKTLDQALSLLAKIASAHYLGVLVIDEIQNLLCAPGADQEVMLNFLVYLSNEVKVPVGVIGTPRARDLLTNLFREARRVESDGSFEWNLMSPRSDDWAYFIEGLWKYQWIASPVVLTKELSDEFYLQTQGVRALVVRLFQLAQLEAIRSGEEVISAKLVRSVATTRFNLVKPMLKALREGDEQMLKKYDDLVCGMLPGLDAEILRQGRIAGLRDAQSRRTSEGTVRTRAASVLIAMGFEARDASHQLDAVLSRNPDIDVRDAVQLVLRRSEDKSAPTPSNDLRAIVGGAKLAGQNVVETLREAGLVHRENL